VYAGKSAADFTLLRHHRCRATSPRSPWWSPWLAGHSASSARSPGCRFGIESLPLIAAPITELSGGAFQKPNESALATSNAVNRRVLDPATTSPNLGTKQELGRGEESLQNGADPRVRVELIGQIRMELSKDATSSSARGRRHARAPKYE